MNNEIRNLKSNPLRTGRNLKSTIENPKSKQGSWFKKLQQLIVRFRTMYNLAMPNICLQLDGFLNKPVLLN